MNNKRIRNLLWAVVGVSAFLGFITVGLAFFSPASHDDKVAAMLIGLSSAVFPFVVVSVIEKLNEGDD